MTISSEERETDSIRPPPDLAFPYFPCSVERRLGLHRSFSWNQHTSEAYEKPSIERNQSRRTLGWTTSSHLKRTLLPTQTSSTATRISESKTQRRRRRLHSASRRLCSSNQDSGQHCRKSERTQIHLFERSLRHWRQRHQRSLESRHLVVFERSNDEQQWKQARLRWKTREN